MGSVYTLKDLGAQGCWYHHMISIHHMKVVTESVVLPQQYRHVVGGALVSSSPGGTRVLSLSADYEIISFWFIIIDVLKTLLGEVKVWAMNT